MDIAYISALSVFAGSVVGGMKLVELFDQYGVSFVSITQSFNTTSSMGRLTLNVLLSFAQFEREVIGERCATRLRPRSGMASGSADPFRSAIAASIPHGHH
jgi:site-specific DNA recombinase